MFLTLISFNKLNLKLFCFSRLTFTINLRNTLKVTSMIKSLNNMNVNDKINDYIFYNLAYNDFTLKIATLNYL